MFGYVRPFQDELLVREAAAYRAFYCGVCRCLGKCCAPPARLMLRYDFAMLALVMDTVYPRESAIGEWRCPINPLLRVNVASGMAVDYAAEANAILSLAKLRDGIADGSAAARVAYPFALGMTKKARISRTALYTAMETMLARQEDVQRRGAALDEALAPFSEFCQVMFTPPDAPVQSVEALRWLGAHIGKWIYLADALDDFESDMRSGAFNPLGGCGTRLLAAERALPLMNLCAEQALAAWDVLPERRHHAIVRNILDIGLLKVAEDVAKGSNKKKKAKTYQ